MRPLLVCVIAALPAIGLSPARSRPPLAVQERTQEVEILAERFSFTPSEIKIRTGTTLHITLRSDDTAHGFRIVGTDTDLAIPKRGRGTATVTFTPENPGRYTFECSHLCGAGHPFMRGVIVVTDAAEERR
jgi:cytochrome c oxidase subunit 2